MALSVYDTAWRSLTQLRVYTSAWQNVKALWQSRWYEQPPGTWNHEWIFLGSFAAPTENMVNVTIGTTQQVIPPQAQVGWSTFSAPDLRSTYNVYVRWFVNGVLTYTDTVTQATGQVTRDFTSGDAVYAEVRYLNSVGMGPITTTSTINL